MSLTPTQVYELARGAGLGHGAAITATAVAKAESGLNPSAVGDVRLADAKWGPSIGLWQIRSLKAQSGTGKSRDASRLSTPSFNAHAMAEISNGGSNFGPWTTYTNGAYRQHLADVRAAVGAGSASAGGTVAGGGASNVGFDSPGDLLDSAGGFLGDLVDGAGDAAGGVFGWGAGAAGSVASSVVGILVKQMTPALLIGMGVLGGFTLIAVGAWRGVSD